MNENIKNVLIALLVGMVGASGFFWMERPSQVVEKPFGALSSPNISSPYLQWGGATEWRSSKTLATATSTVCTLTSPVATSTLLFASIRLDTGTATAMSLDITKNVAGATASSTNRFNGVPGIVLAANAGGGLSYTASSTNLGAALDTFAPNENLNFVMSSGVGGNYANLAPTGFCQAAWMQI